MNPVLQLLQQITMENDKPTKNMALSTFLDLIKAIDIISHTILIYKLEHYVIRVIAKLCI